MKKHKIRERSPLWWLLGTASVTMVILTLGLLNGLIESLG